MARAKKILDPIIEEVDKIVESKEPQLVELYLPTVPQHPTKFAIKDSENYNIYISHGWKEVE